MPHRSGFVTIAGKPNAGKSTLLNAMLGEDLSAVTPKAQTTRHRIKGILNHKDYQVVFSDTPGVIKPSYKLHERMMASVGSSFEDADAVILVIENGDRELDEELTGKLAGFGEKLFVVINKVDLSDQDTVLKEIGFWQEIFKASAVMPISATEGFNVQQLISGIVDKLPEGPPYYDKDELTDKNVRFFVTEMIREQILIQYKKEVPYSCEVVISEYKEDKDIDRIRCEINVDRESQKAILLGHKGAAIKHLGIKARKKIENFIGKKAFLELTVKVKGDWRNDDKQLDRFGYTDQ